MGRGISKVRIKPDRVEDAKKAITREDVQGADIERRRIRAQGEAQP